jgi:hypothetical protein
MPHAIGTLWISGVPAPVRQVTFRNALMYLTACLPTGPAGPVGGAWVLTGTDGSMCYRGTAFSPAHFGVKHPRVAWVVELAANLVTPGMSENAVPATRKPPKRAQKKLLRKWLTHAWARLDERDEIVAALKASPDPLGMLRIAGMDAQITSVTFREGFMHVLATLPLDTAGPVGGQWEIAGTDASTCYRSHTAPPSAHFGTKTAHAAWELTFRVDLEPAEGWATPEDAQMRWDAQMRGHAQQAGGQS